MKRTILAALLALMFGATQAATTAIATSSAVVGSGAATFNVQSGIAVQGSTASASNASQASAIRLGPVVITNAVSNGSTGTASAGFAWGAFGITGAVAGQGGTAFGGSSF
jgi:hypothetical protein